MGSLEGRQVLMKIYHGTLSLASDAPVRSLPQPEPMTPQGTAFGLLEVFCFLVLRGLEGPGHLAALSL